MDKHYSKNTEILKVQKYHIQNSDYFEDEGKDQSKPRKCQKRKIYKVKIKAVNGLEQELANFSHKDLES